VRRLIAVAVALTSLTAMPTDAEAVDTRPNIVLIVADDMTKSDLRWMPIARRLLGDQGVTMQSFLSNHPLCCPARAEILSGQYAQNNGTWHNGGEFGGSQSFRFHDDSLAAWLSAAGYLTAYVGKYLNHWERDPFTPAGWADFNATTRGVHAPNDFWSFNNGDPVHHEGVYTADWVAHRTRAYIRDYSASGAPFFIFAAQMPPHVMLVDGKWVPPIPARRHADLFPSVVSPATRKDSFGVRSRFSNADLTVKQSNIQHRARIRSLQAVDEAVADTVDALRDNGELANTFVVFTSDNGYLLGEHQVDGKDVPYKEALNVPLLVRGPGVPVAERNEMGSLVDLAPTFLEDAGAAASRELDGRSLLSLWREGAGGGNSATLIQSGSETRKWDWRGVWAQRYTYVTFPGAGEMLFDRTVDPYELRNVASDWPGVLNDLRARYQALKDCVGADCVTASSG
jgi:N-acetylglucosamine-6-sulfatase